MNKHLFYAFALGCPLLAGAVDAPKVTLGGYLGERFDTCLRGNVLKLDMEKDFFPPFVKREGKDGGFVGLGKHADAAVHFAWNTKDPAAIAHKEKVIGFIVGNQLPDGYTGCFREKDRLVKAWDIHEMGFIIQGLMSDWELFGNKAALEAARKNVDYVIDRWKTMPDNWEMIRLTDRETTLGFGYGVARLYAATKEEKYRSFLRHERSLDYWDEPITVGRDKMIYGQADGYTGTCLEQLELYQYDRDSKYLRSSFRALDFQTKGDGVLINGNGGICECWTDDQDGEGQVGETCNATFELLFWDELYRLGVADKALLGDLMERCIYNALFAAMSTDGRKLRYYTPLNGDRKFWPNDLYCCPNNFRRGMSRLPEYVFYASDRELIANLYTACSAEVDVGITKVGIKEETAYPREGAVKFTMSPAEDSSFAFRLRIPRWVKDPSVKINGLEVTYKYEPGQLLNLTRVWRKGDRVELDFPMPVRTVLGRKRQSGRFAVMRGPVVYALNTHAIEAFKDEDPYQAQCILMMDPKRLSYQKDETIRAVVSTVDWAVGIDDVTVDQGREAKNVCAVELKPFWHEDRTLTYFRAPNIRRDCREQDELFGSEAK